jgi:hypothetical protein
MSPTPTLYFCPIPGCTHSTENTTTPFQSKLSLLRHLNTTTHKPTHHLADLSRCIPSGIFHCCCSDCPSSPRTFFPSQRALTIHTDASHPAPPHTLPTTRGQDSTSHPTTPFDLATHILQHFSNSQTANHWEHGLGFISRTYDHEPPDFRTTWRHLLKGRNKASFFNLQSSIIHAIATSYSTADSNAISAPFWWLLLHLDMLIFAPSTSEQRGHESIQSCICDRIAAAFAGDIEYLFESAMQVKRLTQNSKSTSTSHRCAQRAADSDDYRTAVSRACVSQSIATIGPDNIKHVNKLYTEPVPDRGHPLPAIATQHQLYALPGNICETILTSKRNKGAGINSDSIDLFIHLVKKATPQVRQDIQYIFNKIYQNDIPPQITRYFTDVYLFCLHKDPADRSKLRPLGIPTAIRRIIATHVARTLKHKFASHLFPYNFAVGIEDGSNFVIKAMQLAVEKYIDRPQQELQLPSRAAVFFDLTNQFNSVARQEFFDVIRLHFPELLPLTTLFYGNVMTVHHKWNDGSWRQLQMREGVSQGCPLSPLFASFVVARLLGPIDKLLRDRAALRLSSGDPGDDGHGGISHLLSYVDDISTCVYLPDLNFLCETLKSDGALLGCFVNTTKTRILTSCNGDSPISSLTAIDPDLGRSISAAIQNFSNTPDPDKRDNTLPVELVDGFRLLGHPVGSAKFASEYFTKCTTIVQDSIKLLSDSISDQHTKLRLFSMCLIQKIPHLLSSDVMYHLPHNDADPPWEEWCGPLTQTTDTIIQTFLSTLLDVDTIPEYAVLISQLGLSAGGLGILCPRLRAAPDFVLTMTSVCRRATRGFSFHKTLLPHQIHPSLRSLFTIDDNPNSLFLRRLHCLLPHFAKIGSAPTTPDESRINAFLHSTSPKSARDRINKYCTAYLHGATHQEFAMNAREHIHLLPSILSPQTSYPLIGMCRSVASHRLPPWIFTLCMKRKLRLPILDDAPRRKCACGRHPDKFGDHAFQCTRICKIGVHNNIRNGLPLVLTPALSASGYLLPTSQFQVEPMLHLPSDPNARPFDISFNPEPSIPPIITHACPYTTIGADITISNTPSCPSIDFDSPDVLRIISANADSHLQVFERRKLCRGNKRDPDTGLTIRGDDVIGDILHRNMTLLPFAIDPFGRLGPLARTFLFGTPPRSPPSFPPSRPNATEMLRRITSAPGPTGILPHADSSWKSKRTGHAFFGNSFTAPTPSISTLQQLGLCISKSFASHIRYAVTKYCDHPTVHTPHRTPSPVSVPAYDDHHR